MRSELSLDLSSPTTMPLESRVYEFKQDPQKMDAMTKFVDDVLIKAQEEAEKKNELNYMTMKQLMNSLDMMRSVCQPKFKVTTEQLDGLRKGVFEENRELKCYTACIAQMAGTVTKKNEISAAKTLAQMDVLLPPNLKDGAKESINACREIRNLFVGLKRGRIVNRARGYVLRFFEAICNCTNTTIPTPSRTRSAPPPSTNKSSSSSSKAPKY